MTRKLGINIESLGLEGEKAVDIIANAGFDCVFTDKCDIATVERYADKCKSRGLELQFLHSPFFDINSMWLPGDAYKVNYNAVKEAVDSAAACSIEAVIVHISQGWYPPEICDAGLARYDELVDYAAKKGVLIAFENLRKTGNVAYFVDRYEKEENVVFCYDCGHEHCYTERICFPDIFGSKMAYTHIHDNFGRSKDDYYGDPDLHLMPFYGNIDYKRVMRKLDEYEYAGSLMLELSIARHPEKTPEQFAEEAFEAIKRISRM